MLLVKENRIWKRFLMLLPFWETNLLCSSFPWSPWLNCEEQSFWEPLWTWTGLLCWSYRSLAIWFPSLFCCYLAVRSSTGWKPFRFSKLAHWYEEKLVKKADQINEYAKWGLFLLVAIPLPGTGAWTGVLVATFLNMKMRQALPMIFLGVLAAGIVMVTGSYGLFGAIRLF